jgi:hypothetical protein
MTTAAGSRFGRLPDVDLTQIISVYMASDYNMPVIDCPAKGYGFR